MQIAQKLTPAMQGALRRAKNRGFVEIVTKESERAVEQCVQAGLLIETARYRFVLTESGLKATQEPNHGS